MSRGNLTFSDDDCRFLILNIIAHDVKHDFSSSADKQRWKNNKDLLKDFQERDNDIISGGDIDNKSGEIDNNDNKRNLSNTDQTSDQTPDQTSDQTPYKKKPKLDDDLDLDANKLDFEYEPETDFQLEAKNVNNIEIDFKIKNINYEMNTFIDTIESDITMNIFEILINNNLNRNENEKEIDIEVEDYIFNLYYFYKNKNESDNELNEIFCQIIDLIYEKYTVDILDEKKIKNEKIKNEKNKNKNKIEDNKNYIIIDEDKNEKNNNIRKLFNFLDYFFLEYFLDIKIILYSFVNTISDDVNTNKKQKYSGGGEKEINLKTAKEFLNEIEQYSNEKNIKLKIEELKNENELDDPENNIYKIISEMSNVNNENNENNKDILKLTKNYSDNRTELIKLLSLKFDILGNDKKIDNDKKILNNIRELIPNPNTRIPYNLDFIKNIANNIEKSISKILTNVRNRELEIEKLEKFKIYEAKKKKKKKKKN